MNSELRNKVLNNWTNLKLRASQLKSQNDSLRFKVNLLLVVIGSGLVYWLVKEDN